MKTSLLLLLIASIPIIDILISFASNKYPQTMPNTKLGRSIFALVSTLVWIIALVFTIRDYFLIFSYLFEEYPSLSILITLKFLLSKKLTKFVPINPDPPVIMTFFIF